MVISGRNGDGQWETVIDITYNRKFFHSANSKVLNVAGEYKGTFD